MIKGGRMFFRRKARQERVEQVEGMIQEGKMEMGQMQMHMQDLSANLYLIGGLTLVGLIIVILLQVKTLKLLRKSGKK